MIRLKNAKTTATIKVLACRERTTEEIERSNKADTPRYEILHQVIEVLRFEGELIESAKNMKSKSHIALKPGEHKCEVKITNVNYDTYFTILNSDGDKNVSAK